jgi:hypothetical protein
MVSTAITPEIVVLVIEIGRVGVGLAVGRTDDVEAGTAVEVAVPVTAASDSVVVGIAVVVVDPGVCVDEAGLRARVTAAVGVIVALGVVARTVLVSDAVGNVVTVSVSLGARVAVDVLVHVRVASIVPVPVAIDGAVAVGVMGGAPWARATLRSVAGMRTPAN